MHLHHFARSRFTLSLLPLLLGLLASLAAGCASQSARQSDDPEPAETTPEERTGESAETSTDEESTDEQSADKQSADKQSADKQSDAEPASPEDARPTPSPDADRKDDDNDDSSSPDPLTDNEINAVIQENFSSFRDCIVSVVQKNPDFKGATVKFVIRPSGAVPKDSVEVSVEPDSSLDPEVRRELDTCLTEGFSALEFPAGRLDSNRGVSYPFRVR